MIQESGDHPTSDHRHRQVDYQKSANFLIPFLFFSLSLVAPLQKAFGCIPGLNQQSTRQTPGASDGTGDEKEVRVLEPGNPIKRELAGGQLHVYQIRLSADQFLKVTVEQDSVDVVVQALGPGDKQISEFDSESRKQEQESVVLVAESAGDYRLIVRPKRRDAPAGEYEIRIEELRAATENDRALHEARKLLYASSKLKRMGKYGEAQPLVERALEIREKILGSDHRDVVATVGDLGSNYYFKGDYAKAETLYQRALTLWEKTVGPEHPDLAISLNNLAALYVDMGAYTKAELLHHRALTIKEKAFGPEHPNITGSIHNLAILHHERGEYAKAEQFYQRSLAIMEKTLGPEHPNVALSLNNLSVLYQDMGDYAKAEPMCRRALAIREKVLGPEHRSIAISLDNLAKLYFNKGDDEKAESFHRRALAIREKTLGSEHIAISLTYLADIYKEKGEYAKAEPLYRRALAILEKARGPDHPDVAIPLNNFANLYHSRGEYATAESLNLRALAIKEKARGPDHPDVATSLNNLANVYRRRGDHAKAESFYRRALGIIERSYSPEHLYVADILDNLVLLSEAKGDVAQAIAFLGRANAVSEHNLALNITTGSEREKLVYLTTQSKRVDRTISYHVNYAPNDLKVRSLAAAIILQRKGRALDATSQNLNALRSRFSTEDRALLDQLTDTRSQIAKLVLGGPQRMTVEQYRKRIKELEDQAEQYEAAIGRRSKEFRALSLPVTLAAVQAAIPANAALIEFASYRPFNAKAAKDDEAYGKPRYVAYVLRHEGEIQWKELGDVNIIDKAIVALRKALRNPNRTDVKSIARAVDRQVFQPLRPLIGETTQLIISPDGLLNLIPFAALVDQRGRYLVERYSISYLASGRDLLRLQVPRESQSGPLVVAAPNFGRRSQVLAARRWKHVNDVRKGKTKEQVEEESAASAFSQIYFSPLPYTAQEGDALRALLPGATLLTKREATKVALSQVRSPALLHIATHGFFLKDSKLMSSGGRGFQAVDDNPQRLLRDMERSGVRIESPLLRSGLALAGANEHKDDGILTALEATGLNLWGTKLVVLSACDTGVGEVKNGDGVHGLRRALVLAGSESQVMSLWSVSDKATRELMVSYYRLLQQGEARGEALRRVQLEMLIRVNRRHPYYWASFIQSGEWANLEREPTR
jgi:CHAT domain-containing protein/Tfp pilus assembly protein PilF